jgi:hypothetical protein
MPNFAKQQFKAEHVSVGAFASLDVQTRSHHEYVNNVKGLVTIAPIYKLPSIITTGAADGPNGRIMPVVAEGLPDATIVHRRGEINAWGRADFVAAVKKTGGKKLLVDRKANPNESSIRTLSAVSAEEDS